MTFDQCRDAYVVDRGDAWKSAKHARQWVKSLEDYVTPVFGKLASVDEELVIKALRPIWKTKAVTAGRVRGRIESVLDWARVQKMRSGENPARWRGHLDHVFAKGTEIRSIKPMAALPFREMPTFMATLREKSNLAARTLEFQILTATRGGEVAKATWAEVDFANRVWIIPAEHTKRQREHRVPLSDAAIAVLEQMDKATDRVFPAGGGTVLGFLKALRPDITAHGFRSTFRDWAAESTDFAGEVCEMALGHSIGNQVEAAYRRGDLFEKRRRLMDAWANYCAGQTGEVAGGNVIRFAK
jgi:integrase